MHKITASNWFTIYSLTLTLCAFACKIVLILDHELHPAAIHTKHPYRSAMDRLIADALPPGWTARHSLYITEIVGPDGTVRAFTYIGTSSDPRPVLVATDLAGANRSCTAWKISGPTSPGGFKAWLAGITAGSEVVARPAAR